ncbi:DHHC palmitoyltransferase-domain-containing protein [Schizophyllum fasciatum]
MAAAPNSPHSLQFAPAPSGPASASASGQRHSLIAQGQQLPLPSATSPAFKRHSAQGSISSATDLARPRSPGTPTPAPRSRPTSPMMFAAAAASSGAHSSSTHAGGIQPSASFFRPTRPSQIQPSQYARYSARRSSVASDASIPMGTPQLDSFQLQRLSQETEEEEGAEGSMSTTQHLGDETLRSIKTSRDPLLPMRSASPQAANLPRRPSVNRERSGGTTNTQGGFGSVLSPNKFVRNSFDRVLSMSHRLSFDSARRSPRTPTVEHHIDERKIIDEEQGVFPPPEQHSPISISRRKRDSLTSSPTPGFAPSLSITNNSRQPTPSQSPSPAPSLFNPHPPPRGNEPPLMAVPVIDEKTGRPVRNWRAHPSRNRFFLDGRVLTGGDSPWAFFGCLTLLGLVAGFWFGATCPWWWHNMTPAVPIIGAYLTAIVISSMMVTAFTDPGILPRNLDLDPPYPATSPSDGGVRAPMPRDLKVRNDIVRVKYCPTCKTYRPPRSSHCKMCDNCVDGCDHHCQWVNNCVGRRNYTSFFVLLGSAVTQVIIVIITAALHLYFLVLDEETSFRHAVSEGWGSAVAFCLGIGVFMPIVALFSYHVRLVFLNQTTIEQIRNKAHKSIDPQTAPPNPFGSTWRRNVVTVLCRPRGYSWLDPHGVQVEDKREINPGMLSA